MISKIDKLGIRMTQSPTLEFDRDQIDLDVIELVKNRI
jgi:hypothetical protein